MDKKNEYFLKPIIPESAIRDSRLTTLERLLLIDILSLCKKKGYCWATNEYFGQVLGATKQTISKSISSLFKYNYIELKYDKHEKNNSKRIIKISEVLNNTIQGIKDNGKTSVNENFNQYNKYNNKKTINNIYKKDEEGNEYWNGEKIQSQEATKEEIEYMENLLKDFNN